MRTTEELSDRLAQDLAWRQKELAQIKALVEIRDISEGRHRVLVRSAVCILYSHWEGFVKLAANAYLDYVRLQKLNYQELSSNFLALAMKEKLKKSKETNKPSVYIPICEFFISELNQRSVLPKDAISTASNLSSEIFKEITAILGLDFFPYSTKANLIDEKLLKTRNEIAHGEYLVFDRQEYIELHRMVIEMLDLFRTQIENAALQEAFKSTDRTSDPQQ
ncbi:MAE_28990/MAE_18760 family HEPN-like nuclease [Limnospira fusiformis]|uniref:MAE_28990/MAE_18760 family HEPN-like nuclease n=1 Tax=Limnospira fusiformis TaxID=54297 RepID=UPI0034E05EA5